MKSGKSIGWKKGLDKGEEAEMKTWHRKVGTTGKEELAARRKEETVKIMRHGIFANKILNPEEKETFDILIENLYDDFQFNKSSDFLQVELVGVYSVKLMRAQLAENDDACERLDRMIRAHMRELKTTKVAREGEEAARSTTSPADWASALLDQEDGKKGKKKKKAAKEKVLKKAKKGADNSEGENEGQ